MAQTLTIKKQIPFKKFRVNGVRAIYAVSIVFNQVRLHAVDRDSQEGAMVSGVTFLYRKR